MEHTPEFTIQFITAYRNHPVLWRVKDASYANRMLREVAYKRLLELYKTVNPAATIDSVKRRINNLRSTFRKELKKVRKSQESGEVYTVRLWYYEMLAFTDEENQDKEEYSESGVEMNVPEVLNTEGDHSYYREENAPSPPPVMIVEANSIPEQCATMTKNESTRTTPVVKKRKIVEPEQLPTLDYSEDEAIGQNVVHKFRRLSEDQRLYAELLISKVLLYGIKGRLQENTDLINLVPVSRQQPQSTSSIDYVNIKLGRSIKHDPLDEDSE